VCVCAGLDYHVRENDSSESLGHRQVPYDVQLRKLATCALLTVALPKVLWSRQHGSIDRISLRTPQHPRLDTKLLPSSYELTP